MIRPIIRFTHGTALALLLAGTTAHAFATEKPTQLSTALSSTTISGYVGASALLPALERTWTFDIPVGDTVIPATITIAIQPDGTLNGSVSAAGQTRSFTGKVRRSGRFQARLESGGRLQGKVRDGMISGKVSWRGSGFKWRGPLPPLSLLTPAEPQPNVPIGDGGSTSSSSTGFSDHSGSIVSNPENSASARIEAQRQLIGSGSGGAATRILPPTRFTPPPSYTISQSAPPLPLQ